MTRKFVQLTPVVKEGVSGFWLYAIADDGTAWRARQSTNGWLDDGWEEVPALPGAAIGRSGFQREIKD